MGDESLIRGVYPVIYVWGRCWLFALALDERLPGGRIVGVGERRDFPLHVALLRDGLFHDARGALTRDDFMTGYAGMETFPVPRGVVEDMGELRGQVTPYPGEWRMDDARGAVEDYLDDLAYVASLPPGERLGPDALPIDETLRPWQSREAMLAQRETEHRIPVEARRAACRSAPGRPSFGR